MSPALPTVTVTALASVKATPLARVAVTVAVAERFSASEVWSPGAFGSRSTDSVRPPGAVSSSVMVPVASRVVALPANPALTGAESRRSMVSLGSRRLSSWMATSMACSVTPGAKASVPEAGRA